MNKNNPFGRNCDDKAIKRFMDTSIKTDRIYLFNPVDAKMMADKALKDGVHMRVNFVKTENGLEPWTRTVDLSSENTLIKSGKSVSGVARGKDDESIVFHGSYADFKSIENEKVMSPDDFLRDHVYSENQFSDFSM